MIYAQKPESGGSVDSGGIRVMEIILFLYENVISTVNADGSLPIVRKNVDRLSYLRLEAKLFSHKLYRSMLVL